MVDEGPAVYNLETPSRFEDYERALREAGERLLSQAQATVKAAGLDAETVLEQVITVQQHPADEIVAEAARWPADLIVLGTHGRRGLRRFLLGSVAEGVARMADRPVLPVHSAPVAHPSAQAPAQSGSVAAKSSASMMVRPIPVDPRLSAMHKILLAPVLAAIVTAATAMAVRAAAPEAHSAGDIPDSQVFVPFNSPLGFSIKVPEGWARREGAGLVRFEDKFLSVQVTVAPRAEVPTVAGIKSNELAALERAERSVRIVKVEPVTLPAGPVIEVRYAAQSAPNPVTSKSVRLDCVSDYAWKAGRMATLTFCAPAGADNADQWALMARSFTWR